MTGPRSRDRLERAAVAGFEAAVGRPRHARPAPVVPVAPVPPVTLVAQAPVPQRRPRGSRAASLLGSAACVAGVALVAAGIVALREPPSVGTAVPLVEAAPADLAPPDLVPERAPERAAVAARPPHASAPPAVTAAPVLPLVPARLAVPRIGVDTTLETLSLDAAGELGVPRRYSRAGWWAAGPRPGATGAAVFVGHVDSTSGPAVFHRLPGLRAGDAIVVTDARGTALRFAVYRIERYPKSRFPTRRVYGATAGPEIRLITCGGTFDETSRHYRDNIVVYARAVRSAA